MLSINDKPVVAAESPSLTDQAFLRGVGSRARVLRERRGMTRKALAREADVSERYLAQLEAGEGNMSIVLLRRVAAALGSRLIEMLEPDEMGSVERRMITRLLNSVPPHRLEDLTFRLMREFGKEEAIRRGRIALVGLRGAGKSTLGQKLAAERGWRYVELDKEIELESGMSLPELFSLYGQSGFRRFERRTLERLIEANSQMVLAVGGGVVAEDETYGFLLGKCFTVWLKASPEEHMSRVIAQGDLRPMAGNAEAMDDLKRILTAREPLYRKADAVVDTSGQTVEASLRNLRESVTA
ncbi:MAG: family transcriptional regulator, aerobic/anaerobic benzoate catabolism transcriptional [Gammaproteobacteria bacterium]|jgi:XRE family aerobic/anaerobic benzoate catabolism transcriptional regulator|nr:family transcriptional regulator, aerobic/anaerobic benzoate catabolism transcriptional [Gammaproteobacteria bacterium]